MPNIILDLRECTDAQKQLVLRVMETMEYTWASSRSATIPPVRIGIIKTLYLRDGSDRKYLLYGTRSYTESTNLENYDYTVPNISTWFAGAEFMEAYR